MERLLLWFLEGLAEGQGGPQARRFAKSRGEEKNQARPRLLTRTAPEMLQPRPQQFGGGIAFPGFY